MKKKFLIEILDCKGAIKVNSFRNEDELLKYSKQIPNNYYIMDFKNFNNSKLYDLFKGLKLVNKKSMIITDHKCITYIINNFKKEFSYV